MKAGQLLPMATFSLFSFFLLSCLVHLRSIEAENKHHSDCKGFICGDFGEIKFPFYSIDMPAHCGLYRVNCSVEIQKIQLEPGGRWYKVENISQSDTIIITDLELQENLSSDDCDDFSDSSLPSSEWLSIDDSLTLFRCNQSRISGLQGFNCKGYNFYYSLSNDYRPQSLPPECLPIRLPANTMPRDDKTGFNINATFSVEIKLPRRCYDCYNRGGRCSTDIEGQFECVEGKKGDKGLALKLGLGGSAGLLGMISISIALVFMVRAAKKRDTNWNHQDVEEFITLKRYSYSEVEKMTKSFTQIVGRGGYGVVYKGKLPSGDLVAVKVLNKSKGNGEEFINEMASMSRTSHMNIVSLFGFCYEQNKRAIIYEYVANGSLDEFISNKNSSNTEWKTIYEIAVGIAQGLEYLHSSCKTRIVHFDIKPQNILLDEDLCPKISDFGLAKLCGHKESGISLLDTRGTAGYIAPEIFFRNYGRVSHKSDVYSYGMLVLEMIGARKMDKNFCSTSESGGTYFPDWIYKDLEREENEGLLGNDIIVEEEREMVKKMILVSLWCIQSHPSNRPQMSKVVEMMEGGLDLLQIPPKPLLFSPAVSLQESSWPVEEHSSSSKPSQR